MSRDTCKVCGEDFIQTSFSAEAGIVTEYQSHCPKGHFFYNFSRGTSIYELDADGTGHDILRLGHFSTASKAEILQINNIMNGFLKYSHDRWLVRKKAQEKVVSGVLK